MTPNELKTLRKALERNVGFIPKQHSDFNELEFHINHVVKSSTLKRIWGYNKDHTSISANTLNLLARHLGYDSYNDFLKADALQCDDHKLLYNASKIADLAQNVHSERYNRAYQLLLQCHYDESLGELQGIDAEIEVLIKSTIPFIESAQSIIAETYLKAQITWFCQYKEDGILDKINAIYESILPLAEKLNDHFFLYLIYENWAYMNSACNDMERAFHLAQLAIRQGMILEIEDPDTYPAPLVSANTTYSYFLIEVGEYEEAIEVIQDTLKYEGNEMQEAYLHLNYAKACDELDRKIDFVEIYEKILSKMEQYHLMNEPINETVHLQAITHYNLGAVYQEMLDEPNLAKAAHHYRCAIALFESRHIPNPTHEQYYNASCERLAKLS